MALTLTDIQQVSLGVSPKSAAGNPAPIENPIWSVSDSEILTLYVGDDGLTVTAVSTGKLGSCQVMFECDSKIGEGEAPLLAVLDVNVVASEAVNISIVSGSPIAIPAVEAVTPEPPVEPDPQV